MDKKWSVRAVINESYEIIKPNFWKAISSFASLLFVFIILSALADENHLLSILISTLASFSSAVFGILYAYKKDFSYDEFFEMFSFKKLGYFLFTTIFVMISVLAGLVLLIIPGIILMLCFVFSHYLVVDKSLSPVGAMKKSMAMTKGHRIKILGFMGLSFLINLLGLICLGVGVLFTAPLTTIAFGLIYKKLSAIDSIESDENKENHPEDSEEAEVEVLEDKKEE